MTEKEVGNNVKALFTYLTRNINRIPPSSTMQMAKGFEDYSTIREEPSLHLSYFYSRIYGKVTSSDG